ncbi:hypothetical protein ACOZ38_25125 [Sphaerisporangium viridialbum]|uniref:hypothetical protein n=1 Tax=Sphaerisporangium viridialbum TaxID=46189 RepID=UPI003C7904D9
MTDAQQPMTADLHRYANQVARQRNDALDEAAKLRAVVEELVAERDELKGQVAQLTAQKVGGGE